MERFWAKVDLAGPGGCWLWIASTTQGGYGHFSSNGVTVGAHRWAYEHLVGPIPEGFTIDHLCRVRACVNPDHLEPVTMQENVLRGDTIPARNAAKTHCKRGHEFTPENTRVYHGSRVCSACRKMRRAEASRA